MPELGTKAHPFSLPDVVSGDIIKTEDLNIQKGFLVIFLSRHCPYVKHVIKGIADLGADYKNAGIDIIAISSNDIDKYPDDAPHKLKEMAQEYKFNFPVCFDESQKTAKAYGAACTPDFFLYNKNSELVYRGQLDDSRPGTEIPVTGKDLRDAIDKLLKNEEISPIQKPSIGCNIKWKQGNEPEYFL